MKELQLFLDHFSYVAEADKQERMKELGFIPEHEKEPFVSVEEKKANLLKRLQFNPKHQ